MLDGVLGEWIMWHAFGDPTLELWTGNPYRLVLTTEVLVQALPDRLHVDYPVDGATLTALQLVRGEPVPVARGIVKGGVADLQYFVTPDPSTPIQLSAGFDNAVSVALKTNPGPPTIN